MGPPLSSFLAEAVMQDLECQALLNDTLLWNRFVDDVLSIIKTQHIKTLFDTIKNITNGINFTMEKEKDRQIAFLDVLLTRTDNRTIETQVYRRETHTDQILNYNSKPPYATQNKLPKNSFKSHRNALQYNRSQDKRTKLPLQNLPKEQLLETFH